MAQLALDNFRVSRYSNNMMMKGTEMVYVVFLWDEFHRIFKDKETAARYVQCMMDEGHECYMMKYPVEEK